MLTTVIRVLQGVEEAISGPGKGPGTAPEASPGGVVPPPPVVHQVVTMEADTLRQLAIAVAELQVKVAGLPGLWKEEVDRAERAAERARKARASARPKPEESDELELAPGDLRLVNEDGSAAAGLHAVRTDVAPTLDQTLAAARQAVARAALYGGGR